MAELPSLDGPLDDFASAQFFLEGGGQAGTFELGEGINGNYATCRQCLLLYVDYDGASEKKTFLADRGTLVLHAPPADGGFEFELDNWRFVEVTIDPKNSVSTPVPDGDCYVADDDPIFVKGFEEG